MNDQEIDPGTRSADYIAKLDSVRARLSERDRQEREANLAKVAADREYWRCVQQEREAAAAAATARAERVRNMLAGITVEAALCDLIDRVAALEAKINSPCEPRS